MFSSVFSQAVNMSLRLIENSYSADSDGSEEHCHHNMPGGLTFREEMSQVELNNIMSGPLGEIDMSDVIPPNNMNGDGGGGDCGISSCGSGSERSDDVPPPPPPTEKDLVHSLLNTFIDETRGTWGGGVNINMSDVFPFTHLKIILSRGPSDESSSGRSGWGWEGKTFVFNENVSFSEADGMLAKLKEMRCTYQQQQQQQQAPPPPVQDTQAQVIIDKGWINYPTGLWQAAIPVVKEPVTTLTHRASPISDDEGDPATQSPVVDVDETIRDFDTSLLAVDPEPVDTQLPTSIQQPIIPPPLVSCSSLDTEEIGSNVSGSSGNANVSFGSDKTDQPNLVVPVSTENSATASNGVSSTDTTLVVERNTNTESSDDSEMDEAIRQISEKLRKSKKRKHRSSDTGTRKHKHSHKSRKHKKHRRKRAKRRRNDSMTSDTEEEELSDGVADGVSVRNKPEVVVDHQAVTPVISREHSEEATTISIETTAGSEGHDDAVAPECEADTTTSEVTSTSPKKKKRKSPEIPTWFGRSKRCRRSPKPKLKTIEIENATANPVSTSEPNEPSRQSPAEAFDEENDHEMEAAFQCPYCRIAYDNPDDLIDHLPTHMDILIDADANSDGHMLMDPVGTTVRDTDERQRRSPSKESPKKGRGRPKKINKALVQVDEKSPEKKDRSLRGKSVPKEDKTVQEKAVGKTNSRVQKSKEVEQPKTADEEVSRFQPLQKNKDVQPKTTTSKRQQKKKEVETPKKVDNDRGAQNVKEIELRNRKVESKLSKEKDNTSSKKSDKSNQKKQKELKKQVTPKARGRGRVKNKRTEVEPEPPAPVLEPRRSKLRRKAMDLKEKAVVEKGKGSKNVEVAAAQENEDELETPEDNGGGAEDEVDVGQGDSIHVDELEADDSIEQDEPDTTEMREDDTVLVEGQNSAETEDTVEDEEEEEENPQSEVVERSEETQPNNQSLGETFEVIEIDSEPDCITVYDSDEEVELDAEFKCPYCFSVYDVAEDLIQHLAEHDDSTEAGDTENTSENSKKSSKTKSPSTPNKSKPSPSKSSKSSPNRIIKIKIGPSPSSKEDSVRRSQRNRTKSQSQAEEQTTESNNRSALVEVIEVAG